MPFYYRSFFCKMYKEGIKKNLAMVAAGQQQYGYNLN